LSVGDAAAWAALEREVIACRRCPRLVAWREEAAAHPRPAFRDEEYWALPAPGFGDPAARILLLGLAPAAHGANRTGRIFTGDRSGDFLWAALHRAGLASQPTGHTLDDGLLLRDCYVTAAVRCAPPGNRPTPAERDACASFLQTELDLLRGLRVIVCLGGFAWAVALRALATRGAELPRPRPRFGHGGTVTIDHLTLIGCYHPSQQNTFTGRLTEEMLDELLAAALAIAGLDARP